MQRIYVVDLTPCSGQLEKIESVIEKEIPEFWDAKSVSITADLKIAVLICEPVAGCERNAILSDAAKRRRNLNIPCHERVM